MESFLFLLLSLLPLPWPRGMGFIYFCSLTNKSATIQAQEPGVMWHWEWQAHSQHTLLIAWLQYNVRLAPYLEILVIELLVLVQLVEEPGELGGPGELVHVEEGLGRGRAGVILQPRTHGYGQNIVAANKEINLVIFSAHWEVCHVLPETINEELFRDVIFAVWVLKCQIELVLIIQELEASVGTGPGAPVGTAGPVNINIYVFPKLPRVIQSTVSGE